MSQVTIVGAGPTGLMLAGELALAGVEARVLERRTTPELVGTRARGFHARTTELLDQRGLADRFLAAGRAVPAMSFADTPLEVAELPSRHAFTLALTQGHVEDILRGWVEELGVRVEHGREVTGVTQDDDGVLVTLADGGPHRTAYLVGADGGRSVVRRCVGIEMEGAPATKSHLIAEAVLTEEAPPGLRLDGLGIHGINPMPDGRSVGIVVTERTLAPATEPTLADLAEALRAVWGSDFGVHDLSWISRFTDATLQATAYRRGRVLIAGDAAHVHPPTGGQGIGLGVQDAVNLGWKLAQVVRGDSGAELLETYQAERYAATARVLDTVMVASLLQRDDARTRGLRATFAELLASREARTRMAALLAGLDLAYDDGEGQPLLGRRMPDLDLVTGRGPQRFFELLHEARPLMLALDGTSGPAVDGWTDRVRRVAAEPACPVVLPVLGSVPTPAAVLVRPDGHVAWVGDGSDAGLGDALTRWFGPPRAAG